VEERETSMSSAHGGHRDDTKQAEISVPQAASMSVISLIAQQVVCNKAEAEQG
jgi:hypothetical protein